MFGGRNCFGLVLSSKNDKKTLENVVGRFVVFVFFISFSSWKKLNMENHRKMSAKSNNKSAAFSLDWVITVFFIYRSSEALKSNKISLLNYFFLFQVKSKRSYTAHLKD